MRPCATTLESELTNEERELLLKCLKDYSFKGKHLEVGTAAGGTLWQMLNVFSDEERPPFVVVDPMKYFPKQLETVKRNLVDHGISDKCADFRVKKSFDAFKDAEKGSERFDWIFIDGAHKLRYVTQDLLWSRLLNVGGLICFHDYTKNHPEVMIAIDKFLRKYPNYEKVGRAGSLLVLKKTAVSSQPEVSAWDLVWSQLQSFWWQIKKAVLRTPKCLGMKA